MHPQKAVASKLTRAIELALRIGNVAEGRRAGLVSDIQATEIFFDLAEKNQDLVLDEHSDPDIKEVMRGCRITLLSFSRRPFASKGV